jgi:hypothetical protein
LFGIDDALEVEAGSLNEAEATARRAERVDLGLSSQTHVVRSDAGAERDPDERGLPRSRLADEDRRPLRASMAYGAHNAFAVTASKEYLGFGVRSNGRSRSP